ncbi:hypothetical protein [Alienimonas californiensis]|uniref:Uncharacterized protein n=1 Tax=Alienimonas californiensis TaxID=2527989 RepID=A0A517P945_9PLAN|nr:hypothetical protein [Alienimonas californiensis]QDT15888.1 hypothetical protein CA12_19840 [Alienimonas californiensis]
MSSDDAFLAFFLLLTLSYSAFAVVAGRRRGPGRGFVLAAGVCGFAGTLIPVADNLSGRNDRPGLLNSVPELVGGAMVVGSFSLFVAAQVLLTVGLLRAWRAREALPAGDEMEPRPSGSVSLDAALLRDAP